MASFVLILKEYEDNEVVIYKFGPNETTLGKIQFDKIRNHFVELEPVPDSEMPSKFYFDRAAQKITKCVIKGEFIERMTFES